MDDKYGQLYTLAEVKEIVQWAVEQGIEEETQLDQHLAERQDHFPKDEPLFLIRGKDNLAAETVEDYHSNATVRDRPQDFLNNVWEAVERFQDFKESEEAEQQLWDENQDVPEDQRPGRPSRMKNPD